MIIGLLRTLLIFFVVYYLFKFTAKYLLPMFVSHRINKMKQEQEEARNKWVKEKKDQEGKVTITYTSKDDKGNTTEGEYVDFEEV